MASMTRELSVAWRLYGEGLTIVEAGSLWALAAAAEDGWAGHGGSVTFETQALAEMLGTGSDDAVIRVLAGLEKKGRVKCACTGNVVRIEVCMWYDRRARRLREKRVREAARRA